MNVIIVDDHVLIRKGIRLLLEEFPEVNVVAEASDGAEAITLAIKHIPDIILMDLSMPDGLDGFTASKTILEEVKQTKIILLTMHDEEIYVKRAWECGIHGYLLKNSQANELYETMKRVAKGERVYQTKIPMEQLKRVSKERGASILTKREQEIVRLTSLGYTNMQIAQQLKISPKTVENHKANIMQKLALRDKHDLVTYAIKNGLIGLL
ncbi:DNA-binding NarL/FixJ family response regulator [Anoxybacillus voinovskiensis]|uniref:DNA-binding NarL/FixJ family response regulator n=1 Tax=Anoxybacteroides voinovskiense TaxID=230470 RepID=A0A840DXS4_9BACL|nr:response regulator transcription factor [Anoxybacillus voinovskiensis]MBB4074798.1 DNA-binding NarL/FixJ family response regulator [Anoxybacillus voinovskiensis]GGJ73587.1 DNA-binding response regulator [Anoxybacillus voinovskiensis]